MFRKRNNIFTCERTFQPAEIKEEVDNETGEVFETVLPIKEEKKSKYLPGQKLLIKLGKKKKKSKLDIDILTKSMSNILLDL